MILRSERRAAPAPFFSICIPQHNRTGLLIEALKVVERQTFKDVEVCISEDCSTDGKQQDLIDYLQNSTLWHCCQPTERNLRYDGNLRAAIGLAQGRYCLLMGNDDCLQNPKILATLHAAIEAAPNPGVVIGNFEDWKTGKVTRRIRATQVQLGSSYTAVVNYRNLAFVSGLIVDRAAAQALSTDKWDGSEMYQMYIFSRVIAMGRPLLVVDQSFVRKDMEMEGEYVDSYAKWTKLEPCPVIERKMPFCQIGRVVADAVLPCLPKGREHKELELIFRQLYMFTYPFWMFEYRRIQSWNYAVGVCLGMRPGVVVGEVDVGWWRRMRLRLLWLASCLLGLSIPISLFDTLKQRLYSLSRSFGVTR